MAHFKSCSPSHYVPARYTCITTINGQETPRRDVCMTRWDNILIGRTWQMMCTWLYKNVAQAPKKDRNWCTSGNFSCFQVEDILSLWPLTFRTLIEDREWKWTCRCYNELDFEIETVDPHNQNELDANNENILGQLGCTLSDTFIRTDRPWTSIIFWANSLQPFAFLSA